MEPSDRAEVDRWLRVNNDAYERDWGEAEFRAAVVEHRHIEVTGTFFIEGAEEPLGVASFGFYRTRPEIAAGHYFGVVKRVQGQGLAKQLVVQGYAALRDQGYLTCETQTHIGRQRSLRMHFDCGFVPVRGLAAWNNPDDWSRADRLITDARLFGMYRRWHRTPSRRL
jgi:GNAT superfamily N-acetyltransferase